MLLYLLDDGSISKTHWQSCRSVVVPMGGLVEHCHFDEKEIQKIKNIEEK